MARWAGWGAGPAGAGAAGTSRVFLALALVGSIVVSAILVRDHRPGAALVAAAGALYFALRLFAGLGQRRNG